jgi:hypothetical protein
VVINLELVGSGDIAKELEGGGAVLDDEHVGAEIDDSGRNPHHRLHFETHHVPHRSSSSLVPTLSL